MYEYKIKLDEKDYIQFNDYHLSNSRVGKKTVNMIRILVPILFLCAIFIFLIANADVELIITLSITAVIVSILMVFYSKKLLMKTMTKSIKTLKKDGKLPFNIEATITFDEAGIHEKSLNSESKTNYVLVEKIGQNEHAVYIYISAVQAYIIPITCFSSDREKDEFLEYINTKCIINAL